MKIKHRVTDFRVSELLEDGYIRSDGPFSVFRVTKRKLSTPEAVHVLAERAGVDDALVAVAGLKDRQGVTAQHMSVPGRQRVRVDERELRIEHVGFADHELSSEDSRGNAFHVVVRSVDARELAILRRNLPILRAHGVPNYFDDQRFGNLRHDQGWIARDLMLGHAEQALGNLLAAPSPFDHERLRAFKSALRKEWGDWRTCRDVAGRFGSHHSIFEYLTAHPGDFGGAFYHVASRLRLIHLFAYQSHVWNRAVAELVRRHVPPAARVLVDSVEGSLVCFEGELPARLAAQSFPLPGPGLADVANAEDRALLAEVLAGEGLAPEDFRIDGVPGFQLKGEERELVVHPRHLRVRPPVDDPDHPGASAVALRFELPRGAYATLLVKRLFARSQEKRSEYQKERSSSFRRGEWIGHGGREDDSARRGGRTGVSGGSGRRFVERAAGGRDEPYRAHGDRAGRRGAQRSKAWEGDRDRSGDWSSVRPPSDARGSTWRSGSNRGGTWRAGRDDGGDRRRGDGNTRHNSSRRDGGRPWDRRGGEDRSSSWRPSGERGERGRDGGQRSAGRGSDRPQDRRGAGDGGDRRERGESRGASWRGGDERRRGADRGQHGAHRSTGARGARGASGGRGAHGVRNEKRRGEERGSYRGGGSRRGGGDDARKGEPSVRPAKESE